jgi:MoaE-MoaD fusion protein
MQVRVLFFGQLKDVVGRSAEEITLPAGATIADVVAHYASTAPRLREFIPSIAFSLNQEYAAPEVELSPNDEVALLPPVSGGAGRASLVRQPINTARISQPLRAPEDGALAVFEGIVRDNSRGRRTLYLDYEAYEPMALTKLEELAEEALAKFDIRDARVVHRLGRLEIGDTSVLIVVASAHRAAAFDACRWLIDTLKRTVPIWKKEHFADGAVWADGEPFPADVRAGKPEAKRAPAASK